MSSHKSPCHRTGQQQHCVCTHWKVLHLKQNTLPQTTCFTFIPKLWNKCGTGYSMLKLFNKTNNRGMMENYPSYVRFLTSPNKIQLSSALHMIRILGETCLLSAPFIIWLKHFYLSLFYFVLDEEKTQVSESSAAHRALTQWVESKWFSHIP